MIWLGLIVLLSWGSVGSVCVCKQSPTTSLLRGLSPGLSLCRWWLYGRWESLPFSWLQNLMVVFWILIISRYRPNFALCALFGVLRSTQIIFLENSACGLNVVFVQFSEFLVFERNADFTPMKGNGFCKWFNYFVPDPTWYSMSNFMLLLIP